MEPDVFGYTVCIGIGDNHMHECRNVTATEVIVPKYYFVVNVMITAWNIVGESPVALCEINPCTDTVTMQGIKEDQ